MTRREIIQAAKSLVAHSGPYNVLEFGTEMFTNSCPSDSDRYKYKDEIVTEAYKQAERVLDFLGL